MLSVGCSKEPEIVEISNEVIAPTEEVETQIVASQLTEKDFEAFFKDYFSFSEEELLMLNQSYNTTDEAYWNHLTTVYEPMINKAIGKYLGGDLKATMKKQYVKEEINLPKWLFINQYIVSGQARVERIEIRSMRDLGSQTIYEIAVTTENECYPANTFLEQYGWGEKENYFVKKEEGIPDISLEQLDSQDLQEQSYIFSEKTDYMKLEQHYWIALDHTSQFQIVSINTATSWGVAPQDKHSLMDSQYVSRVPFETEATTKEVTLLTNLFKGIMNEKPSTYTYYNKAYDTSAEAFEKVWDDMGLGGILTINEADYQSAFQKNITPYKDGIIALSPRWEGIQITPSLWSTAKQPRFIVTIPTEALLNSNQKVYYNYKYFVGMENSQVELLQFMAMASIDEASYQSGMASAEEQTTK